MTEETSSQGLQQFVLGSLRAAGHAEPAGLLPNGLFWTWPWTWVLLHMAQGEPHTWGGLRGHHVTGLASRGSL